jgi:hypothetical protein
MRREHRLDEMAEVLATLAATSARQVDAVCAPDSDVAIYARAACLRAHTATIVALAARVGTVRDEDDPWERIARELEVTSAAQTTNDAWYGD